MNDPSTQEAHKRAAAERAVLEVRDGMLVGLGSGSTATYAVKALARLVAGGLRITAIPTSHTTEALARDLGITLTDFSRRLRIDVTIDGADQVALGTFDLIKGLGGALLREKIVAAATDRMIVVIDESKLVSKLGDRTKLPVEIASFGYETVLQRLVEQGCNPMIRWLGQRPFKTDGGNCIADCSFAEIADPLALEARLAGVIGVVESGLFIDMVSAVMIGRPTGVEVIES